MCTVTLPPKLNQTHTLGESSGYMTRCRRRDTIRKPSVAPRVGLVVVFQRPYTQREPSLVRTLVSFSEQASKSLVSQGHRRRGWGGDNDKDLFLHIGHVFISRHQNGVRELYPRCCDAEEDVGVVLALEDFEVHCPGAKAVTSIREGLFLPTKLGGKIHNRAARCLRCRNPEDNVPYILSMRRHCACLSEMVKMREARPRPMGTKGSYPCG